MDGKRNSLGNTETSFRNIIRNFDSLFTRFDQSIDIQLIVKDMRPKMIDITCKSCGNTFSVLETDDSGTRALICENCQKNMISLSKMKYNTHATSFNFHRN